jgi:hypothetical protein
MKPVEWVKHVAVFVAAVFLIWLGGVLPAAWPKYSAGVDPFAGMPAPTMGDILGGLLAAWPIFIALAICQALTFHYVKKFSTPIFLGGVFLAALVFAMRYAQVTPPA